MQGTRGSPGYHFVVLLLGCFPASLFAIQEMLKPTEGDARAQRLPPLDDDPLLGGAHPVHHREEQDRPLQQHVLLPAHLPGGAAAASGYGGAR